MEAEQNALRMEFVLQKEMQEAERIRIQAKGVSDAQIILAQGLNQEILQFKAIEAFLELAESPNAKVIITDSSANPLLMNPDMTQSPQVRTGLGTNK